MISHINLISSTLYCHSLSSSSNVPLGAGEELPKDLDGDLLTALVKLIAAGCSNVELYQYSAVLEDKIARDTFLSFMRTQPTMNSALMFLKCNYSTRFGGRGFSSVSSTVSAEAVQASRNMAADFMTQYLYVTQNGSKIPGQPLSAEHMDSMYKCVTVLQDKIARNVFWAFDTYRSRKRFLLDIYKLRYQVNKHVVGVRPPVGVPIPVPVPLPPVGT